MSTTNEELEAKLLSILQQPEETTKVVDAIEVVAEGEEEELTEEQRATLQSLLEAGMPSPDEIIREAKCAEHNAKIQATREADLAARRERRAKGLRPKKQTKSKKRRR